MASLERSRQVRGLPVLYDMQVHDLHARDMRVGRTVSRDTNRSSHGSGCYRFLSCTSQGVNLSRGKLSQFWASEWKEVLVAHLVQDQG